MRGTRKRLEAEPFRDFVFCWDCYQWGMEDQFTLASEVVEGVIKQVLRHFDHVANRMG